MTFVNVEKVLKKNNAILIHINSTDSTMNDSKSYIDKLNSNFVVISDEQKNGKGRMGNKWISPLGNIYCSIGLKFSLSMEEHFFFSILTLISIKKTLSKFGSKDILFKWPNDVLFQNKKFGGILLESYQNKNKKNFIIIGMGLNFSSSPTINNYETTYIKNFSTIDNKYTFLENFFEIFFYNWNNFLDEKKNLYNFYRKSLILLGQKIKIKTDNQIISGVFKDINYDGSIILDIDNQIKNIYSGNIVMDKNL